MDDAYRRMTHEQKLQRAMGLSATLRALTLDHLRELHPDETERQLKIRLLLRTVSADVLEKAFGWLPPEAKVPGG
jgi:RecB family exonuclease